MEIIAEIGQNHNGDMSLAVEMIRAAKENGADAVKFQLYEASKLFPKDNNPWFEYNCKTELSKEDVLYLVEECKRQNIEFLASAFDVERVDWLQELNVRRYKIASRSIYDNRLISHICGTGKSLLVSLGMWQEDELPKFNTKAKVYFLYCVSKYPTQLAEMKLSMINFKVYTGISDHTIGISAAMCALSRGAKIVEKHFTLDKQMYGPDHSSSMTPNELMALHRFRTDLRELLS